MSDKLLAEWFWTDRWMGSSAFLLPMETRGVYREMLTQAWRRGAKLPANHEQIRRAIGCTAGEWRRAWPAIEGYWRVDGDSLVNDTQQAVYAEAFNLRSVRQVAGSKGGKRSASKRAVLLEAKGQAKSNSPSPSPSPTVSSTDPEETVGKLLRVADDSGRRAGAFVERYQDEHLNRRGVAYIGNPRKDYEEALQLVRVYDDATLNDLMVVFLASDDDFTRSRTATVAMFRSRASWCQERLQAEKRRRGIA
jgi:uncharacterized protein YdaU (DUF1376 family)